MGRWPTQTSWCKSDAVQGACEFDEFKLRVGSCRLIPTDWFTLALCSVQHAEVRERLQPHMLRFERGCRYSRSALIGGEPAVLSLSLFLSLSLSLLPDLGQGFPEYRSCPSSLRLGKQK